MLTSIAPISKLPSDPVIFAPPLTGTSCPVMGSMPIWRLKNSRSFSPASGKLKTLAFSKKNWRFSGKNSLYGDRLNSCVSTSASAKSVLAVKLATRLERSPSFTSTPPVCSAVVPGTNPLLAALWGKWLKPPRRYGLMMNNRPLPISETPCNSPASLTLLTPKLRRHALHRSSSFLRRMKRLKLIPQTTSRDCIKLSVEKGIAMVAVQPSSVMCASEVQTPSHPGSPSPSSVRVSSVIRPSR